ncbi:MAG: FAD/FMN-dependent dehydrogenase [Mycobacterium sp.]|nr:FAD/FMN-dependent dehydrogenase [Mycobacterium sp.]
MTFTAAGPGALTGRVVRQGDADYLDAKAGWNLLFAHDPAVVVFALETRDVVNALVWARQREVPVRIRSGGHCLEGWSNVDGGIVIDVSQMKSVVIDPESHTATVGAGLDQLEAVTALGEAGYLVPTGTEGTVGLVGATLGGGFGLLTRSFGMASDNLLAAEVVVPADHLGAQAITVDETNHVDLLWALRGAGNGNFGIVTSLTYRIHPLRATVYVTASWAGLDGLAAVFEAWQGSAPFTDQRLTTQLEIGRDEIQMIGVLAGGSESEAARLLSPILSVGHPDVSIAAGSWAETYAGFQIPTADEPANWKFFSQFISEPFPAEAIAVIGSFMAAAPTSGCNYFTNALGGAVVASEPVGGSVFAHRGALFYAEPGAGWGVRGGEPAAADPLTPVCEKWVADFADALAPFVNGAYVNVPNAAMPEWGTAYWGAGLDRLRTIKAKYDPDDVFTFEQSVPSMHVQP